MNFTERVISRTEDGRRNVTMLRLSLDLDGDTAFIDWETNGELYYIKTPAAYRRKGIATKLWHAADDLAAELGYKPLRHSEYRTDDGDAFARSMTDDLPTRVAV